MEKSQEIKKYPYLGYSANLIEYFLILGYETTMICNEIIPIIDNLAKVNPSNTSAQNTSGDGQQPSPESKIFSDYKHPEKPTIINSVSSDFKQEMLDDDIIINLVFPSAPTIYFSNNDNSQYEPNQYSIIFFFNSDEMEGKSKIPFHFYSLIFYEIFKSPGNKKVFMPKGFTLVSQFPFFSLFNYLAKEIHRLFKSENEIPIEILIYNIVNFVPSPLNNPLQLNLFPYSDGSTYSKYIGKKTETDLNKNAQLDMAYSFKLILNDLSGYPIFDFNGSEGFNILPLTTIVQVLIFNVGEREMLFFSKNLEVLNLVMYIIASLSYPCNDSLYLWQILSVSWDEVSNNNGNNKFIGKPFASMIGINCTYNESFNLCELFKAHFIVDLDNKKFNFGYDEDSYASEKEEIDGTLQGMNYIDKILNGKKVASVFLEKTILKLVNELTQISKKIIHNNYGHNAQVIPKFFTTELSNGTLNKNIQESFYNFIMNIGKAFYPCYSLKCSENENKKKTFSTKYAVDLEAFPEEEQIFYHLGNDCVKYQKYREFHESYSCLDLYQIPGLFSEEFIGLKNIDEDSFNTHLFEIMDNFYLKKNIGDTQAIHFHQFYSYYESNGKDKISDIIIGGGNVKIGTAKAFQKTKKSYKYINIELNNSILFNYLSHLSNGTPEKMREIFPTIKIQDNNVIKTVHPREIPSTIERSLIQLKEIKGTDLLNYSLMMLIAVISEQIKNPFETTALLLEAMENNKFLMRKYMTIVISIYYRIAERYQRVIVDGVKQGSSSNNKTKVREAHHNQNEYYRSYDGITTFLMNKKILPNKELYLIMQSFSALEKAQISLEDSVYKKGEIINPKPVLDFPNKTISFLLKNNFTYEGTKDISVIGKLSENIQYDGFLGFEETKPVIDGYCGNSKILKNIRVYSHRKIYNTLTNILKDYEMDLDSKFINKKEIEEIIVNLMFYYKYYLKSKTGLELLRGCLTLMGTMDKGGVVSSNNNNVKSNEKGKNI